MAGKPINFKFVDNREYSFSQDGGKALVDSTMAESRQPLSIRGGAKGWDAPSTWMVLSANIQEKLENGKDGGVFILREDGYSHDTQDPFLSVAARRDGGFSLKTGNLIGSISRRDNDGSLAGTVTIGSRFGDSFLRHIVSDADGFASLRNRGGTSQSADGYDWLLGYYWNVKLQHAFRLGMPKCYREKSECLTGVRGNIDVVDYYGYSQKGRARCTYRELSYGNPAAQLFVAAWDVLNRRSSTSVFCSKTVGIYQTFMQAIGGKVGKRKDLLDVAHFKNAFFADYNGLIDLSKTILRGWGSDFSVKEKADAILFDVSMLYEYFLRKLFVRRGIRLVRKEHGFYRIPTCPLVGHYSRKLIPDLVFDLGDHIAVFDAKYKYYDETYGVSREDAFQLHAYIGQYGNECPISACGFIYPIWESRWRRIRNSVDPERVVLSEPLRQQGKVMQFNVAFLVVPDSVVQDADKEQTLTDEEFDSRFSPWVNRLVEQLSEFVSAKSSTAS